MLGETRQQSLRTMFDGQRMLPPQLQSKMESLKPGEVILCKLFHEFTILADKKIELVLAEGEKPLAKSLQRGEDPIFDQLLTAFGSVAEHCLPSMLRTLFEWHNRQISSMAAWIEKVANGSQETTSGGGGGSGASPLPAQHSALGGGVTYSVGTAAALGLRNANIESPPTRLTSSTTCSGVVSGTSSMPSSSANLASSSPGQSTLQSSGLTPELAALVEKRDLAVEFIFCLVLIEVLKQLHLHPGYDDLNQHIENLAFQHFHFREDVQTSANLANINMIADLYAEVIGVVAQSHFQSVRKRFMAEFKELRQREPGPITTHCIISLLMGMKFFRIKMAPIEELVASFQFMHECAGYFLEVKDKDIKHALAGLFVEILVPVAATVKNEVNVPCLKTFVELLYSHTMDLCTKKKHILSLFPLVTCLLCVSHRQFFLSNWHFFLTMCLQHLKNRDAKMSRVALESLYRLLWVYMIRIKCESNSVTQTRLHAIVNSLFPKGTKAIVPRDTPLTIFVKIIQFIAQEKLEFAMKEIVFDLLSVGRPIKIILTPERMSIGLRAFLVVADSLQQKDGEPPMPRSLGVLPSGNTLRVKKTFLSKMLTDEMAKNIGMNPYYPQVRKAFSEILKALDLHLGRPLMMTKNINKEPDEMLIGEKKPKIDLFRTCVAAIPRLIPDGITKTELIDLLSRLTVHMDDELNMLAFQALQNLVVDFPDWREDVVAGFVHFIHSEIEDVFQRLIENALRRLYQLMTSWKNSVQQQQQQQQQATIIRGQLQQQSNLTTTRLPGPAKLDQIANVLNSVDGLALVMLCYCRQPTRKLAAYILKESRTISNLLLSPPTSTSDHENVMPSRVRKYDDPVATIIDQNCPEVIGKCFGYISTNEKATIIALSYQVDLQWLAERAGPSWIFDRPDALGGVATLSSASSASRQSSASSTVRSLTSSIASAATGASVAATVSSLGSITGSVVGSVGPANASNQSSGGGVHSGGVAAGGTGGRQQTPLMDGSVRDGSSGTGSLSGGTASAIATSNNTMIDRKPSNTAVVASSTLLNTTTLLNESSKLLNRQDSDLKLGSWVAGGAGLGMASSLEEKDELKLNAWNVVLMELMNEVVARCPNAVAQAWPIVCERLNSVLQLLDPSPVNDNRGTSILRSSTTANLKRAATTNLDRSFYLELWKNYLMFTCKIAPSSIVGPGGAAVMTCNNYGSAPPHSMATSMAESCASPDSSLVEGRTNPLMSVSLGLGVTISGAGFSVEGNRSPIMKNSQTAQTIFKKILPKVRSEHVDIRNAAILGLAQVNPYAFADLLEELVPYLREVLDQKQENARRRRKREMLRLQIGRILRILSERRLFVDCPPGVVSVDRSGEGFFTLSNVFLEYMDGARVFFESEPSTVDKEANPVFVRQFRESFCHFTCNLLKCFPLETRKDKMTREMRHQLFNLFVGWSHRYSHVFWEEDALAKGTPPMSEMTELEYLALRSMSAVLCAGPVFRVMAVATSGAANEGRRSRREEPETSLLDSTNLYAWLMMLLKAEEPRLNDLGLETIILLLENNLDESGALLEWLIECCYTKVAKIADACFTALVTIFSVREYPCDRFIAILVVTMINIGRPRLEIQQLASQLLQILYRRFYPYLNIDRICRGEKESKDGANLRETTSSRLESTPKKSTWTLASQRSILNKIMDYDIIDPNYTPLPSRKSIKVCSKTFGKKKEDARLQQEAVEPLLVDLYPCTMFSIARKMAYLHPQMTMIVFSEITFRFQTATPELCQDLLHFLIPWLYNMQLVDPIVQQNYDDEDDLNGTGDDDDEGETLGTRASRKQNILPNSFSRTSAFEDEAELFGSIYREGWGSIESTVTVLNNLFFITCKFGDDHAEALEAVWAALSANRPNNLKIILKYLFIFVSLAPNELLPFAKRVAIYLARAQPGLVIDQLMVELQAVEFLSFSVERTEAFPFFRVVGRKSSSSDSNTVTASSGDDGTRTIAKRSKTNENKLTNENINGSVPTEAGMLHTKRHSKDLHGDAKIGNEPSRNADSFPGSGASSEDYNLAMDDVETSKGGSLPPDKPATPQPRPLPMPEFGGYQAPLKDFLLNSPQYVNMGGGGWNVGFHRCNLALMLLCDMITQDIDQVDWSPHIPLMLHILFLGMDHSRPIVYEHCKQLLLNLLIVTGKHEDSLRVARILLKNRVLQQNFGLTMSSFSTFPTYSLNNSSNITDNRDAEDGQEHSQQPQNLSTHKVAPVEMDLNQIFTKSDCVLGGTQQQPAVVQSKKPNPSSSSVQLGDIHLNMISESIELEQQLEPESLAEGVASAAQEWNSSSPVPQTRKARTKFSLDLYIKSLIDFISRKPGQQLWNYEDITAKVWSIRSAEQMSCFAEHVTFVFKESLPSKRIQQRWAEIALQLSLSCSSRHYAGRSLQIFRALKVPINTRMLSDILSRLVETISEPGEDMQGYVTELMLTLESAIDSFDFRPRNILDLINEYFHFDNVDADIEFEEEEIDVACGNEDVRPYSPNDEEQEEEDETLALSEDVKTLRKRQRRRRTRPDGEEMLEGGDINNIDAQQGGDDFEDRTPTSLSSATSSSSARVFNTSLPTSQSHYESLSSNKRPPQPPRSTSYSMSFPTRRFHFEGDRSSRANIDYQRLQTITSSESFYHNKSKCNSLNSVLALNRSLSAQSLKNLGLANRAAATHLEEYMVEDKNSILAQFLWIAVIMLETDYEHEFQLALRVLDKVLSKLSLDDPDCQEKIEKIFVHFKWHNFPGVHALLLKGCASPVNYEPTINLLYKLTPYLKMTAIDPTKSEQSFPFHVMAILPYLLQNYDDPNALCIEVAISFAEWCNEDSSKLENLATVMTLYSKRCFSKENQQWTKCVVKYLYDAFASSFVDLVAFLVEMAERGPPVFLNHIITILHSMLNYIDLSSAATASINNNLVCLAGRYIEGPQWREALKILKLAVTRCSSLATPLHYGSQGSNISSWSRWSMAATTTGGLSQGAGEFGVSGLVGGVLAACDDITTAEAKWWTFDTAGGGGSLGASSMAGASGPSAGAGGLKRELPGRTMDFQFDLRATPVAGLKFIRKRRAVNEVEVGGGGGEFGEDNSPSGSDNFTLNRLFEEQTSSSTCDTASHTKVAPRTSAGQFSSHLRMRERLIGLLNRCGQRSVLPKSPSVIFSQNSDVVGAGGATGVAGGERPSVGGGDHRSSMASSIEDISTAGGASGTGATGSGTAAAAESNDDGDSKHDDAISHGGEFAFFKEFDFLEYELESQEGESLDNFNWGVRRKSLSNLEQNLSELKKNENGDESSSTTGAETVTVTTSTTINTNRDGEQDKIEREQTAEQKKSMVTIATMTTAQEEDEEVDGHQGKRSMLSGSDESHQILLRPTNDCQASNISDFSSDEEAESGSPIYCGDEMSLSSSAPLADGMRQASSSPTASIAISNNSTRLQPADLSRPASLISSYGSECEFGPGGLKSVSECEDHFEQPQQPFLRLINKDDWIQAGGGEMNLKLVSIFRAIFKRIILLTREACECLQQQSSLKESYGATATRFLELLDLISTQIDFPFVHLESRLLVDNAKAAERIRFVLLQMHAHWETFNEKREILVENIAAAKATNFSIDGHKLSENLYRTFIQLFLLFECYLKFIDSLKAIIAQTDKIDNRSSEIMSLRRRLLQCSSDDSLMVTLTENCHYSSNIEEGVLQRDNEEELARLVTTQQLGKAIKFVKMLKAAIPDLPGEDPIETLLCLYCRFAFAQLLDVEKGEDAIEVVAITEPDYNLAEITKQLMDANFMVNSQ